MVSFTLTPGDNYTVGDVVSFSVDGKSFNVDVTESSVPEELVGDVSNSQYSAVAGSDNALSALDLSTGINEWAENGSVDDVGVGTPELSKLINYWSK